MKTTVDQNKVVALASKIKRLSQTLENNEIGIHNEVSRLTQTINANYSENSVRQKTSEIDAIIKRIRMHSKSITSGLNDKVVSLNQAADRYRQEELDAQELTKKQIGFSYDVAALGGTISNVSSANKTGVYKATTVDKSGIVDIGVLTDTVNKYVNFTFTDANGKKSPKMQIYYEWGGKMTLEQLNKKMIDLGLKADDPKLQEKIISLAKSKDIKLGIDCSGLVLRVLDKATNGKASEYYRNNIKELKNVKDVCAYGVSAANMTSLDYSTKITNFNDVRPGDYIRFDNGKHIGVVYKVEGNVIYYAHSSGSKGPHTGTITVTEAGKDNMNLSNAKNAKFNDWDKN